MKENISKQEAELINLRSYKVQSEIKYQEYEVVIQESINNYQKIKDDNLDLKDKL